jgi:serine/threonine protein kinase
MGCCFSHYGLPEVTPFPAHVEHPVVKPKPTYRRPPVKLTEIDESGSGDDHAALVSYSINGRNGYKATESKLETVSSMLIFPSNRSLLFCTCSVYELMDHNVVGRGGFGVIHRVTHKFQQGSGPLPQYYALKRTRPFELDRHVSLQDYDDITYKVGEVRSLLALRGAPNTLQIREFFYDFEASRNAASLALVTELMTGQNLNEWIHENRSTMTEKTVSLITRSLLNAVRYFHGKNIVHRDIKVSNLRITVGFEK